MNPAAWNGWPGWLNGCVGDGVSLAGLLAQAGFTTQSLINDHATRANVTTMIAELAEVSAPGDLVVIHYSGHGGREDYGLFGGWHETLCLSDGSLLDVELRDRLAMFKTGVRVVVILDSCHSGGMDRSHGQVKSQPAFVRPTAPRSERRGDTPITADVIILAACQADETAVETNVAEYIEVRGAFTWSLCQPLEVARKKMEQLTVAAMVDASLRACAEQFPKQHPRVIRLGIAPETTWNTRIA